ncbi:MAG: hypothetical protein WAU70_16615, partial [Flavobacteriales bacterium]
DTVGSAQAKRLETWRLSMARIKLPKIGAFEASYPDTVWHEVDTVTAPPYPYLPKSGPRPFTIGNGDDVSAQAPSGHISSATGSFDSVTGVTSETGLNGGAGSPVANSYSLQLNTDFFPSTVAGSAAGCRGWEQFLYSNNGTAGNTGRAFIQYWLIDFGPTSPGTGWIQGPAPSFTTSWFRNSTSTAVPNQPISNLANLSLGGSVTATGDSYFLSTGTTVFSGTGLNAVNAAAGWTIAEFCIVGNCCGSEATFNAGSTIVPRTRINYGGREAPNCVAQGFTGETNNLSFGPTAPGATGPGPAVIATESSAGGATANCLAARTVGDTHLSTFAGLLYDFQASGDFVLAEVDDDFVVHTRQVSSAPTWPDASVNSAVATRMGKTTVAVCLETGLIIDNVPTALADGSAMSAADGVDISRNGNVYFITGPTGNSVRATMHSSYIDVLVGIGSCCGHTVKGLLANHNGNVDQLEARDGTVLTNPFNFDEFQHHYTDSWRVSDKESLLPVCGKLTEVGIPKQPFFARDLDEKVFGHAREVAMKAGVEQGPLLDAATLDVAVIGDDNAAKVFVGMHAPLAVGQFVTGGLPGYIKWSVLVVLLAFFTWFFIRRRNSP